MTEQILTRFYTPASSQVQLRAWEDGELTVLIDSTTATARTARVNIHQHRGEPIRVLQDLHARIMDGPQPLSPPLDVAQQAQLLMDHCNQHRATHQIQRMTAMSTVRKWIHQEEEGPTVAPGTSPPRRWRD